MGKADKLSKEEFIMRAIQLSREDGWAGCHTIFSGFNAAFKAYFGEDPEDTLLQLEEDGKIRVRDPRGGGDGKMLYPVDTFVPDVKVKDLLAQIMRGKR